MPSEIDKLKASLKSGTIAPVYLLQGEESFFIDEAEEAIVNAAIAESERDFNLQILYGEDTNGAALLGAAKRYPVMAARQAIVVREAQNVKGIQDLEAYMQVPLPTTVLVLCFKTKGLDKRTKMYGSIAKKGTVIDFKRLSDKDLPKWTEERMDTLKITATPKALSLLGDHAGNELQRLDKILIQLAAANLPDGKITEAVIEQYVGISKEYNLFEFISAIMKNDSARIAKMLYFFSLNPKEAPMPKVLGFMYPIFSKLIFAKQGQSLKELGVNNWQAADYENGLKNYSLNGIRACISILHQADMRFKGILPGGGTDTDQFTSLILSLIENQQIK